MTDVWGGEPDQEGVIVDPGEKSWPQGHRRRVHHVPYREGRFTPEVRRVSGAMVMHHEDIYGMETERAFELTDRRCDTIARRFFEKAKLFCNMVEGVPKRRFLLTQFRRKMLPQSRRTHRSRQNAPYQKRKGHPGRGDRRRIRKPVRKCSLNFLSFSKETRAACHGDSHLRCICSVGAFDRSARAGAKHRTEREQPGSRSRSFRIESDRWNLPTTRAEALSHVSPVGLTTGGHLMADLDSRKDPRGLTCMLSAIVAVLAGRLLFSDAQVVRLVGATIVIVAGSLFLISCWRLFRSKTR
jgi:hypothetical protein